MGVGGVYERVGVGGGRGKAREADRLQRGGGGGFAGWMVGFSLTFGGSTNW